VIQLRAHLAPRSQGETPGMRTLRPWQCPRGTHVDYRSAQSSPPEVSIVLDARLVFRYLLLGSILRCIVGRRWNKRDIVP